MVPNNFVNTVAGTVDSRASTAFRTGPANSDRRDELADAGWIEGAESRAELRRQHRVGDRWSAGDAELPRALVEYARRIGIGLGDQPRAPGRHDLCVVVHLRQRPWLVARDDGHKTGANTYSGKLYTTRGPAFNATPWDPAAVVATETGTATFTFSDANNGTFNYVIGAVNQTKTIARETFGPLPTCTFGAVADLATATNFQDLWWKKPATSESGWGINLNHQGDTIFATWFTYDLTGAPLWLVVTAPKTAPGVYYGDFYRTSGPRFDAFKATERECGQGRHGDVHLRRRQQRDDRLFGAARGDGGAGHAIEDHHPRNLHRAGDDLHVDGH